MKLMTGTARMAEIIIFGLIILDIVIFFIVEIYRVHKIKVKIKKEYYANIDRINYLEKRISELKEEQDDNLKQISSLKSDKFELENEIDSVYNDLNTLNTEVVKKQALFQQLSANVDTQLQIEKTMEETSQKAFQSFCEILEKDYEKKDKEYEEKLAQCKLKFDAAKVKEQNELNRLRNIRKAMQEAQLREEQLKEKQDFYRLIVSNDELNDVLLFEELKSKVKNKRAVSMLIWSTWYQKPMTELCNKILGAKTVCGIYKITNIKNNRIYIGQAVDVASRIKQHAKCGLGIDTPAGNKLYAAMQKDGLSNFTWELLEECKREELNERERYYIEAYMSKDYGYNSNIGVK